MRKFNVLYFAAFICAAAPFAAAQTTPSGIPISELEQFVNEYAAEHIGTRTAGASIAAIKDGEIVFNRTYGYAIQDKVEVGPDTVFEWGSGTKLLVWTSVMQLAEQGRINLNADIRTYLPENFLRKLKYETPITMYNLMHHNAGWEDRMIDLFYANPNSVPNIEKSLLAWEPAQIYRPGEITAYSNFGTTIAGYIVERITGQQFYEYVWENIFIPLGMTNTSVHPLQADNPSAGERRAQIMGHFPGRGKPVPFPMERIYIGMYPAGSAIGTAEDVIRFLSALMPAEGETSVLFRDNETLNTMLSTSFSLMEGFPGFAHGFVENFYAVRTVGHGGNTAAFSSLFTFYPEERFGLVVLTNQAQETALCYLLTKEIFGEYEPQNASGEFADARKFSGTFYMARKAENGFSKLLSSLAIFPVKAIDENTIDIGGAIFIQVSPNIFKNTGGFEFLDIVNLIAIEEKEGKAVRASVVLFDLLPASAGRLITLTSSMIAILLCVLYVLAGLIIIIAGSIKNKKKGVPSNKMKKLNVALYSGMAAAVINNLILIARTVCFSTYASLTVHFVINIIYMIAVPLCIGIMIAKWKEEPSKGSKVFNIFTMALAFIFAVLLLAWEFWK